MASPLARGAEAPPSGVWREGWLALRARSRAAAVRPHPFTASGVKRERRGERRALASPGGRRQRVWSFSVASLALAQREVWASVT